MTIDNDERIQEVEHFIEEWPKMSGHGDVIYSVCTTAGEFSLRVPTLAALIELARAVEDEHDPLRCPPGCQICAALARLGEETT